MPNRALTVNLRLQTPICPGFVVDARHGYQRCPANSSARMPPVPIFILPLKILFRNMDSDFGEPSRSEEMQHMPSHRRLTLTFRFLLVLTLAHAVLSQPALAKNELKTYPEEGKVVGTGVNSVTRTRIYKVATDTRAYELDCGKHPLLFSSTPGECGGEKKIQIGDIIHFRIEKDRAYIQVPPAVEPSGEQKLRIQREEAKPNAPPKKPDAN